MERCGRLYFMAVVAVAVAGCAQPSPPAANVFKEAYDAVQPTKPTPIQKTTQARVPEGVARALLPPMDDPEGGKQNEVRFNIAVDNAPAREFFNSLVAGSPLHMVIHPDVQGVVSLNLKNVTMRQVVETACELHGFDCRILPSGFRVFPRQFTTRTFRVDFLPLVRKGYSGTLISSGVETREFDAKDYQEGKMIGGKKVPNNVPEYKTVGAASTSIDTLYRSDFWGELREALRAMLRLNVQLVETKVTAEGDTDVLIAREQDGEDGRSIMINRQAGLVMVRALPSELREVESYLSQLRERSVRQVILEAKIVEVELADGYRFGIDWLAVSSGMSQNLSASLGGEVNRDKSWSVLAKKSDAAFSFASRVHDFTLFMDLLQSQGKVQVLSSPRISALNNQKAVIKVGEDSSYMVDMDYHVTTTSQGIIMEGADPSFATFFSGVSLDVTPQIGEDGLVTLHIHPMVSDVRERTQTVQGHTFPTPVTRTRETDNIIRAHDGEVVVIGGLMKKEKKETEQGVPVLGDLPVLGALFRHTSVEHVQSELVILMRPMIVQEEEGWGEYLRTTAARIRAMEGEPLTGGGVP